MMPSKSPRSRAILAANMPKGSQSAQAPMRTSGLLRHYTSNGIVLIIDVTVVRGLTATAMQRGSHQPGDLLARAEQGKRERYAALMDTLPGDRFVPFAVDDYGAVGDHAQMLLEELSYRAQARRAIDIGVHGRTCEARRVSQLTEWRALISSGISRVGASITMQAMERLFHPTTHSPY